MTAATNVYGKNWRDGGTYYDWDALGGSNMNLVVGAGYNNQNWVTAIRFELPGYAGKLSFSWCTGTEHYGKGTLNYKLTKQEEPDLIYADHNTVGDGSVSPMQYDYTRNTLEIEQILSPGTYYLYLWSGKEGGGYTSIYWRASGTYKATLTYDDIPGTASAIALTGGVLGQPVTMHITRDNADFLHTLTWSFAGHSGTVAEMTGDTAVSWTPDANVFGAYIPAASSGVLTVSCATYYDAQQIGTAQTASITLSLPSDAAPVLNNGWAAVSHSNSGTSAAGLSACIAGHSKAVVIFDAAKVTARYGAQIKSLTAKMGAASIAGSGTIGTVTAAGNSIILTATDTRNKSTSETVTLTAHPYRQPVLAGVTVFRCDSAGAEDDSGAFYSAKATASYSDAGGEISCALTAAVKAAGGSYGAETPLVPGVTAVLGGFLSDTVTYIVRIQAQDTLGNTASVEVTIPTAAVAFHIREGGDGMGLGKYNEAAGYIDSAWGLKMNGNKITGLGTPMADGDAVPLGYAKGAYAPAGYGLGKMVSQELTPDTVDSAKKCGWYGYYDNTYNSMIAGLPSHRGLLEVLAWERVTWQYYYSPNYGGVARRYITEEWGSTWSEWECINPPMIVGIEYRTTERWNGSPVYVKLINLGEAADNKSVQYSTTWVNPIRVEGYLRESTGWQTALPMTTIHDPEFAIFLGASSTAVTLYVGSSASAYLGRDTYAAVYYTK